MKTKSLLAWSAAILAGLAAINIAENYRKWKAQQIIRLETESQLLNTTQGILEYQMEGEGPVVLLIHGSPGSYDQSTAQARYIDLGGYTTLAVSRPGYRRTPLSSGKTPEEQADLYAAMLDALNIAKVTVLAVSGGGPSTLQFALRHPERCQGLIMVSALTQNYSEERVYLSLPPLQRRLKQAFERLMTFDPLIFIVTSLLQRSPESVHLTALLRSLVMNNAQTPGYQNDMRQFEGLPTYNVQEIKVPALIIHGSEDRDIPIQQARAFAEQLPHAQMVAIEGATHVSALSGKQTLETLRGFLKALHADRQPT